MRRIVALLLCEALFGDNCLFCFFSLNGIMSSFFSSCGSGSRQVISVAETILFIAGRHGFPFACVFWLLCHVGFGFQKSELTFYFGVFIRA